MMSKIGFPKSYIFVFVGGEKTFLCFTLQSKYTDFFKKCREILHLSFEWVDILIFSYSITMILYTLLGLLIGGLIWYMIAYARFGNAKIIEELRTSYWQLEDDLQQQAWQLQELSVQNKILKSRAQQLLDQNEDYSKVISQLSRFYFRLKQTSDKLKELTALVAVVDEEDLTKKLDGLTWTTQEQSSDDDIREEDNDQKKFF